MDQNTAALLVNLGTGILANFGTDAVKSLFDVAFNRKPDLERRLQQVRTSSDLEQVFRDAVGVIDASAGTGSIAVDRGLLEALRGIRFDHQHGQVTIQGTTMRAPVLVTGGSETATGSTFIGGNTSLRSAGTSIEVGHGASITMTGGASIKQS